LEGGVSLPAGDARFLFVDADDTLWENNIYFERVIACVQSMLQSLDVDPHVFRCHLDETERRHVPVYGYGTTNFCRSLVEAFGNFLQPGCDPALKTRVEELALGILQHPIEVLDGVPETLEYLASHHQLFLVTKGCADEQRRKIDASNLSHHFHNIEILSEKNVTAYRHLVEKHSLVPDRTWMVGNSPRSDINPAIAAGLGAVYIPHPHTWILEHEEPVSDPRVLELRAFSELRRYF
jgi:putative hydrolase of the HAD superfamily